MKKLQLNVGRDNLKHLQQENLMNNKKSIYYYFTYLILITTVQCHPAKYEVCSGYDNVHTITSIDEERFPISMKTVKKFDFLALKSNDTCYIPGRDEYDKYILSTIFYPKKDSSSNIKIVGYRFIYRYLKKLGLGGYTFQVVQCRGGELYSLVVYIDDKKYILDFQDEKKNTKIYNKILSNINDDEELKLFEKYREDIINNEYCLYYGNEAYWE